VSNVSVDPPRLVERVADGIRTITLHNPKARNALTFAMWAQLKASIEEAGDDPETRVVVITGSGGKAFASGTDIVELRALTTAQHALDYEAMSDGVLSAIERCPKPTIAAMAGAVTGGGAAIAVACDLRIAAANLRFGMPIARTIGNCIAGIGYARFAAIIGSARVLELIYTARLVDADEAKMIGLVTEVLESPEALAERAEALAFTVASHAPLTLRVTKEALRRLRDATARTVNTDDLLEMCFTSRDFRHGIETFLAGERPFWEGR